MFLIPTMKNFPGNTMLRFHEIAFFNDLRFIFIQCKTNAMYGNQYAISIGGILFAFYS